MKYTIEQNNKSAYMQLYEQIKDDIISGVIPYMSKLPSKRNLSADTNVSVITVEHAYNLLIDEGYVESRERSGYFSVFRSDGVFHSTSKESTIQSDDNYISEEFTFPFSVISKAMRKIITEHGESLFDKSNNRGNTALRKAIKDYLISIRGINADEEQIIIGSGSEYLYNIIVALTGRDNIYAIESPSYHKIELIYKLYGIEYEPIPLCEDGVQSDALWKSKAKVLHVSPYRSFPSGITASASKRHEYILWASKRNGIIIEDDFESEFSVSGKIEKSLYSMSKDDNVIYVNSFSKTISPSIRVSYMILPKSLLKDYKEKVGFLSCTVPTYMQYLLAELINNGDFLRHINRVRRKKRKELQTGKGADNIADREI